MAGMIFSKASGLNDTIYGKSQEPIRAFVESKLEAWQQKSLIDSIFNVEKTNKPMEKFSQETSMGNFKPVGEGGTHPKLGMQVGYEKTLEADTWKAEFEVTMEMAEDALIGKVKKRAGIFADSYGRTREMYGAAMLAGGLTGSATFEDKTFDCTTADGVALFSTAHTSITGGSNQSNLFAEAFSYDALCLAQQHMQQLTDDDGHLLGLAPDTIIIPNIASLKKAVFNAVGTEGGEPGQAVHGMNYQNGLWNVLIWPFFNLYVASGKTPWIIMDSTWNQAYEGALWRDRIPLSVRSEVAANDNNVWKGRARYIAGFNDWRCMAYSESTSGGTDLG